MGDRRGREGPGVAQREGHAQSKPGSAGSENGVGAGIGGDIEFDDEGGVGGAVMAVIGGAEIIRVMCLGTLPSGVMVDRK